MAADLALGGLEVNLFELPQFRDKLEPCVKRGGIEITGAARVGFAKLAMATTDVREALQDVDLVMVTVRAFGHEAFVRTIAPHLNDGQVVVFNTGYFACLRFRDILRSKGKRVLLAENMILPYSCRVVGPGHVHVYGKKKQMYVAALPATDTKRVVEILRAAYPEIKPAVNVLKTSLDNLNLVSHAAVTLLNKAFVERADTVSLPVPEGVTPSVAKLIDALDRERIATGAAYGVQASPVKEMLRMWGYETRGDTTYELYQNCDEFRDFCYPYTRGSLHYQGQEEDFRYGLVPIASLAKLAGVSTPTIDAFIRLFSIIDGVDYDAEGVTIEKLGLSGLGPRELTDLASR